MPINNECKLEALDIQDELIAAISEAGPEGLTFQSGCDAVGMSYDHFYHVINYLILLRRVKIEMARTGNKRRILLPDWDPPVLMLAPRQQQVFDLLCEEANADGLVQISFGKITKRTGVAAPSFALERLDYKGCVEVVESGGPLRATTYRVYPNRDGPRWLSEAWFKNAMRLM